MTNRKSSKDSASRLFNRYVWLIDIIFRSGNITFEKVNSKWMNSSLNENGDELPLKTFHNHRNAIQEMFHIDIVCNRRAGYIYYIENKDEMEHGIRSWLLNTFAINNLINESQKLKHRILFEQIPSGQQYLSSIIEAMHNGRTIEITYKRFDRNESSTFEIEPYCVKVFKQRWYVVAKSVNHDQPHIYALDRILSIQESENSFTIPENFNAEEYFQNCYGIINREDYDAEIIEIKIFDGQAEYLRSLPLHYSQKEIETKREYSIFRYYIKPTYDFRQELLSKGAEVEVLSPEWFRDELASIAKTMHNRYN